MIRLTAVALTATWIAALAVPAVAGGPPPLPDRDPDLARRLVAEGALLIDTRSSIEYWIYHLPGARHISISSLAERLPEVLEALHGDRNRPIVVYCLSGHRSAAARRLLEAAGFTQVTNLGTIFNWWRGREPAAE